MVLFERNTSDNSVELSSVVELKVDHFIRWDIRNLLDSLDEVEAITTDLPSDLLALLCLLLRLSLVLSDERGELCLVINHEHLLHIAKAQTIVGVLG